MALKFTERPDIPEALLQDKSTVNIERSWMFFKNSIIKATKDVCLTAKTTEQWKWKQYLMKGSEEECKKYKEQGDRVGQQVVEVRMTQKEFGKKMEWDYHTNQNLFYRVFKKLKTGKKQQKERKQIKNTETDKGRKNNEEMEGFLPGVDVL